MASVNVCFVLSWNATKHGQRDYQVRTVVVIRPFVVRCGNADTGVFVVRCVRKGLMLRTGARIVSGSSGRGTPVSSPVSQAREDSWVEPRDPVGPKV
ncbi:hypothetical protein OUZ56_010083 [Daphnia magna]|uniref:Uncharacterized protein n=1 Tax=Daphnia magna TaxID=35525 RepID=A0ABR0AHR8_9CRUS|nr:hypothetical protein OUZ56_010083 [Daphnia magna]